MDRRSFIKTAAAGAGLLATGTAARARAGGPVNLALPNLGGDRAVTATGIDSVVVVMMENRSVDHYLGWYADENSSFNATQTRTYVDELGTEVPTENWGWGGRMNFAGCGFGDPGHGHSNGLRQAGDDAGGVPGEPDGFLKDGAGSDEFAVSYYGPDDIPVTAALTRQFTTFDNYFCSWLGSTYPNREYMHSAQSGGITDNSFPPERTEHPEWRTGFDWPTIWTFLEAKGVTWKYYYSNLPVIALWGKTHAHNARHISEYYADCAAGTLPEVCFVDPFFVAPEGLANDDHPSADIRLGQMFLSDVTRSFMESRHWETGALFITYDEWGGFWDHVAPPTVSDPRELDPVGHFGRLGFRVPTQLISPYAAGGKVDKGLYDHTSILKFIVTNWGLTSMDQWDPDGARDPGDRNIGNVFGPSPTKDVDSRDEFLGSGPFIAPPTAFVPCVGHNPAASDLFELVENGWMAQFGFRTDFAFADSYRTTLPILR